MTQHEANVFLAYAKGPVMAKILDSIDKSLFAKEDEFLDYASAHTWPDLYVDSEFSEMFTLPLEDDEEIKVLHTITFGMFCIESFPDIFKFYEQESELI